ncbi:MAG: NosD domain-containing protein, partial [Candidatus Paceibacterota bacterium]
MKKRFLELPIHRKIFFATVALSILSAGTFAGIFYAQKAFTSPAPSSPANFRMPTDPFQMRGETSGIGTHFTITNSEYLNIVLNSTETVDLKLTSIPKVITMMVNPATTTPSADSGQATQITLSGLVKNTTYYKYEDDYHNLAEFTTDENGKYSYSQDISARHFVFIQTRKSTKFISDTGGDCVTIGNWNQSTKTCTLTQDLTETVQIDSDGITLDGNGHAIISAEPSVFFAGVLVGVTGVTVKNLNIANFMYGMYLDGSGNIIRDNTVSNNSMSGIWLMYRSFDNRILNNILKENGYLDLDMSVSTVPVLTGCNNIVTGNISSGDRPIGFFNAATILSNRTFSELILCNADHSNISNVTVNGSDGKQNNGFLMFHTDHSNFTDIASNGNFHGAYLNNSHSNTVKNITSTNDIWSIFLDNSDSNGIKNISASGDVSMLFWSADGNDLDGATLVGGANNADFHESNSNRIHNFTFSGWCNIYNNDEGANTGNLFYNNSFVQSCRTHGMTGNSFNLAKPIGGNYWSEYDTPEEGCNDANNDGFCDAPYVIPDTYGGGSDSRDNLPWMRRDGWKTVKVAVVLAETSDVKHASASKTEQPCKLIPAKTYPNGHDKTYYDDMLYCVKDYYRENSYGTVNVEYTVFPTWYKLQKPTSQYIGKEGQFVQDAIAKSGLDVSGFDVVSAVHSGNSAQLPIADDFTKLITRAFDKRDNPVSFPPFALIVAENDPLGAVTHEIGHNLGSLSVNQTLTVDLYKIGNMNMTNFGSNTNHFAEWDLMGKGSLNYLSGTATGTSPSQMSSYTKEFLGWLTPDIHKKSEYDTYTLVPLEFQNFGNKTLHYNLTETTELNFGKYYQIEARKKDASKAWSATNPSDSAIVLYKVDTHDQSPYGYTTIANSLGSNPNSYIYRSVNVMCVLDINGVCKDLANLVKFTYAGKSPTSPYQALVSIASVSFTDEPGKIIGAILTSKDLLKNLIPYRGLFPSLATSDFKTEAINKTMSLGSGINTLLIIIGIIFILWILLSPTLIEKPFKKTSKWIKIIFIIFCIIIPTIAILRNELDKQLLFFVIVPAWIIFNFLLFKLAQMLFEHPLKRVPNFLRYIIVVLLFCAVMWLCLAVWVVVWLGRDFLYEFGQISPAYQYLPLAPSLADAPLPDLDLHAVTPDGRHIGMNYQTNTFENQIAGSEVSGDMQGDEEWIFVPSTETVRYYVSAHDTQAFFDANPDIASQVPDKTDKY